MTAAVARHGNSLCIPGPVRLGTIWRRARTGGRGGWAATGGCVRVATTGPEPDAYEVDHGGESPVAAGCFDRGAVRTFDLGDTGFDPALRSEDGIDA